MSAEELRHWAAFILALLSIGGTIFAWLRAGRAQNADAINLLKEKVQKIETDLEHTPTKDDFHKVENALVDLSGQVNQSNERTSRLQVQLDRIESFLLKGDK